MKASKPIAYSVSAFWDFSEILYSCRKCGADFSFYADREKYCHRCGQVQDWNVLRTLPDEYKEKWKQVHNSVDIDGEREIIQHINEINNAGEE